MVALIRRLLASGHAYWLPGGGVYYDVRRFPRYGALSRFSPARMRRLLAAQDDARLDDPRRRHPLDFALWRKVPAGPNCPSPFGRGRPGWHLECSAMAQHHLGVPVDIHGGGADLIFPHHEAEIAQSEAAWGRPFVRFWLHVAPMRLGGQQMSKSTGNMVFVRNALRETHPEGLRLYLLAEHYRRPYDHDGRRMAEADAWLPRFAGSPPAPAPGRGRRPSRARRFGCSTGIWTRPRCFVYCGHSRGRANPLPWRSPGTWVCASSAGSGQVRVAERVVSPGPD
jgi:cysteinyl-tRNA synthetase